MRGERTGKFVLGAYAFTGRVCFLHRKAPDNLGIVRSQQASAEGRRCAHFRQRSTAKMSVIPSTAGVVDVLNVS